MSCSQEFQKSFNKLCEHSIHLFENGYFFTESQNHLGWKIPKIVEYICKKSVKLHRAVEG